MGLDLYHLKAIADDGDTYLLKKEATSDVLSKFGAFVKRRDVVALARRIVFPFGMFTYHSTGANLAPGPCGGGCF